MKPRQDIHIPSIADALVELEERGEVPEQISVGPNTTYPGYGPGDDVTHHPITNETKIFGIPCRVIPSLPDGSWLIRSRYAREAPDHAPLEEPLT